MTHLAKRKRRARYVSLGSVFSQGQHREVCVELHPQHMELWLKGCKTTRCTLTYSGAYGVAMKAQVDAKRREKAKAKKEGGGVRC